MSRSLSFVRHFIQYNFIGRTKLIFWYLGYCNPLYIFMFEKLGFAIDNSQESADDGIEYNGVK